MLAKGGGGGEEESNEVSDIAKVTVCWGRVHFQEI